MKIESKLCIIGGGMQPLVRMDPIAIDLINEPVNYKIDDFKYNEYDLNNTGVRKQPSTKCKIKRKIKNKLARKARKINK